MQSQESYFRKPERVALMLQFADFKRIIAQCYVTPVRPMTSQIISCCSLARYRVNSELIMIMFIKSIKDSILSRIARPKNVPKHHKKLQFVPSMMLSHHSFQSVFNLLAPIPKVNYEREKVFFMDGGHISLDWVNKAENDADKSIIFIMHGMTGGSEESYIRIIAQRAEIYKYPCVCLNSRGINNVMTSPIPFVGLNFFELETALKRVRVHFPTRPIHLVGTSLGCNYLLRFLLKHLDRSLNIKSLSMLCPPFNVKWVIDNMNPHYQKYFIRSYIQRVVTRHDIMKFWWENGVIDYKSMCSSKNLRDFHERVTQKILGLDSIDILFDQMQIKGEEIVNFELPTLIMFSKDDPMIGIETLPIKEIEQNPNMKLILTEKGGHMCWFEGMRPQRWYPKQLFQFLGEAEKK